MLSATQIGTLPANFEASFCNDVEAVVLVEKGHPIVLAYRILSCMCAVIDNAMIHMLSTCRALCQKVAQDYHILL